MTQNTPAVLQLDQWLASLGASSRRVVMIGGTGHLDLAPEEQQRVMRELEQNVMPQFAGLPDDVDVIVATGLAPGADLVIAEGAHAGFVSQFRRAHPVGLLPVPVEVLWEDWRRRMPNLDPQRVRAVRERFDLGIAACHELVQLWNDAEAPDWSSAEVRRNQYRRLAALLAEQCDVLVAVLRPDHRGQPGGTAEVVAWREGRAPVPDEIATTRRHPSGWPQGDRLIVIDPTHALPALPQAREALRSGNYLLAYDLAMKLQRPGRASEELEYVKLQALANAGSTQAALRRFEELPLALRERDEDWLALAGRLHKDLGLRGGPGAAEHFRRSAERYRSAFDRTGGYFSAINAATTSLLGGATDVARTLAREVLKRVDGVKPTNERDRYYLCATEAEAALLLGEEKRARIALAHADRLMTSDINARSRTRRQLRLVCRALKIDASVLDALTLPPVVYVGADVPVAARDVPPHSFAYAGITVPAELAAAEQVLSYGARLHAVLAAPRERMVAHWSETHGPDWARRLGELIEAAPATSTALGFLDSEDRWADAYVGATAVGLSRLAARRLDCAWRAVGVDSSATRDLVAGEPPTAIHHGGVLFTRRFAGVIFADFAGFSRVPDAELPIFWGHFMRAIGARLAPVRHEILLRHTWGDALHLVLSSARATAEAACAIQACLEEMHPTLPGALAGLELRLAAHYAPVFAGQDPIEEAGTFFGTQLSFTARIEPVTPPGMIFVTEAFAAQLALEAPDRFAVDYAGEVRLAKAYGQSRLFSLRMGDRGQTPNSAG